MIEKIKKEALAAKVPIIEDEALAFICDLIQKNKLWRILELGSAVAYSTIAMAMVSEKISIEGIERDDLRYAKAIENISITGLDSRIKIYHNDIDKQEFSGFYDLIFVDAAKASYQKYLDRFIHQLNRGGMMIFDNINFHNLKIEEVKSRRIKALLRKIDNFKKYLDTLNTITYEKYEIGDGLIVIRRREDGII